MNHHGLEHLCSAGDGVLDIISRYTQVENRPTRKA